MNSLINDATAQVKAAVNAPAASASSSTAPGPPAVGIVPVTPAAVQAPPAAALDKVAAEPSIFDKALNMAQPYLAKVDAVTHPYVEKVQATKPYTDAAMKKVESLMDKVDQTGAPIVGTPAAAAAHGGDGATSIKSVGTESTLTTGTTPVVATGTTNPAVAAPTALGSAPSFEDRLDGAFASIQRRASAVAKLIDEKTASGDKPGLYTQASSAVQKVTDKADAYISGHGPAATNQVHQLNPGVPTTTNTVPHADEVGLGLPK